MSLIPRFLITLAATCLLLALRKASGFAPKSLKIPVGLPLAGLWLWTLSSLPVPNSLQNYQTTITTAGQLALLYGLLSLVGWFLFDLPSVKGWWKTPPKIFNDICIIVFGAIITLVVLQQAGVSLSGLITTSAFLTAVIGFAAQEPLKDIFGGLGLQFDHPFKEGDWIEIGDQRGQVISLTLMNTYIRSGLDGCTLIIPNDTVAQAPLRKIQPLKPFGNCFEVGLDYSFPPSQAIELLLRVVRNHSKVLDQPAPNVWVKEFDDSAINYGIQVWHLDQGDVMRLQIRGQLLEQIWYSLERIGQSIPFPVRTLTRKKESYSSFRPVDADDHQKTAWLSESQFFSVLSDLQIADLAPLTRCLRFAKGEIVIKQGESGDCCFHVIEGAVEVFQLDSQGIEHHLAELGKKELFGEMAVCTNEPRAATIRAIEETILLEIERQDLRLLIDQDAALLEKLAHLVLDRQQATGKLNQQRRQVDIKRKSRLIRSMQKLYNVIIGSD